MKRGQPQPDVLDQMTKEELVTWIRERVVFQRPKMSEVLFIRWQKQAEALQAEREQETRKFQAIDFKERDRLATRFNESKDPAERLRILELIQPFEKALQEHRKRYLALDRKEKRVDALYEQIDVERQKENSV
ncbi:MULTISPECIES: hypothetical protein [unclassified Pseudomonas]|uniref:hypothetical protein n=1 Tax=unclassified Pseudomonas TaxID=196821 RepID=UPI000A1FC1C1|nr:MULTISPECIES: hypothetical protein [unclassified Pseudomonas]